MTSTYQRLMANKKHPRWSVDDNRGERPSASCRCRTRQGRHREKRRAARSPDEQAGTSGSSGLSIPITPWDGVGSVASDPTEAAMSRHKKDPLRELTEPERQELILLSRSQAAPAA